MARLYDSVWVEVEGRADAVQASKDRRNPAAFNVGDYQYDIDGRPLGSLTEAPRIVRIHSLESARAAGLAINYNRDVR